MHRQQTFPQPPATWIPGTIATALVAAVLGVGVLIGQASMRDEPLPNEHRFAPSQYSVSPMAAEPWAVFVDSELPMAYVRQPSGEWAFVRRPADSSGGAASAE